MRLKYYAKQYDIKKLRIMRISQTFSFIFLLAEQIGQKLLRTCIIASTGALQLLTLALMKSKKLYTLTKPSEWRNSETYIHAI